jgi:hypothetical protein
MALLLMKSSNPGLMTQLVVCQLWIDELCHFVG